MTTEMLDTLSELARQHLGFTGELRPELRLAEDLELDSVRLLTLAMAVEDHFKICLDEGDEAAIVTVRDLALLVEKKLASA